MGPAEIALIAAALLAGSFVFGAAGFAFGLVTVPLLSIVLPIKQAIALQLPYAFLLCIALAWHYRRHLAWHAVRPLLVGALVALPLGVAMLEYAPERMMKLLLAAFIVVAVVLQGRPLFRRPQNGYAYGAASGWFQGSFTTGAPPAMIYLVSICKDPRAVKGTNGLYFIFLYSATAALYAAGGIMGAADLTRAAAFAPAVLAGGLAGHWFGARLNFQQYRVLVNGLLIASALMLAWRA
ncbi:MAG: hypothetical protein K0R40_4085 [Burkholderiales bacterium]|jgi:uncharacterized membrane protein YfcA|nr:hypothetical protein [Burkholderiales bacterium]